MSNTQHKHWCPCGWWSDEDKYKLNYHFFKHDCRIAEKVLKQQKGKKNVRV